MSRQHDESFQADIAEIQGLYGAFSFPEKLLQKIWLRREFDFRGMKTLDGRRVRVVHPGRWNLLGGPDFRLARLRFDDGPEIVGDVEIHLRASDWDAHGHAKDPAYANVVLHVVLFWPEAAHVTRAFNGGTIPTTALLPLLHHDLEEYAADEAVESLSNRPAARVTNELAVFPPAELRAVLDLHAMGRWRQKVHFAADRVSRLGWEGACHHAALEVLGFRYNRAPMLRIASRWPLVTWEHMQVSVDSALELEADAWSVQGVRPANQPRTRLRQYAEWTAVRRSWPTMLAQIADELPKLEPNGPSGSLRRRHLFVSWRARFADEICGGTVGGGRLDNLICDAFLPLLAAREEALARPGCWYHWFCGDLPPFVSEGLRHLGVCDGREQPACHGLAQGMLGWLIEREVRR